MLFLLALIFLTNLYLQDGEVVKSEKRKLNLDLVLAAGAYGIIYKYAEEGEGEPKEFAVKKPHPQRMIPSLVMEHLQERRSISLNSAYSIVL